MAVLDEALDLPVDSFPSGGGHIRLPAGILRDGETVSLSLEDGRDVTMPADPVVVLRDVHSAVQEMVGGHVRRCGNQDRFPQLPAAVPCYVGRRRQVRLSSAGGPLDQHEVVVSREQQGVHLRLVERLAGS